MNANPSEQPVTPAEPGEIEDAGLGLPEDLAQNLPADGQLDDADLEPINDLNDEADDDPDPSLSPLDPDQAGADE